MYTINTIYCDISTRKEHTYTNIYNRIHCEIIATLILKIKDAREYTFCGIWCWVILETPITF